MIGVFVDPSRQEVAREFFELFKTPWEFYRADQAYDVVLCCGHEGFTGSVPFVIHYSTAGSTKGCTGVPSPHIALSGRYRFPVYGDVASYETVGNWLLSDERSKRCLAYSRVSGKTLEAWIGYDLFAEIEILLTIGQPPGHAGTPTFDLHIAFLRDLIVESGIPLLEVPPVPNGFRFIACLTHDVDQPSLRIHGWDHTTLGFLYRATAGSLLAFLRARMPLHACLRNLVAAIKLLFIQLGLARDLWSDFVDQYLSAEQGRPSSFFFIPFANNPGRTAHGSAPAFRASRYGAADLENAIMKLKKAECDVGLHGIDAWIDTQRGRMEIEQISHLSKGGRIGVRMHWLYFDQNSPERLEDAGADYDSTCGYNETVGYRAGTAQAFKPLAVSRLLELPLHIMDTALFYPTHLGLTLQEAQSRIDQIQSDIGQFGGCLTSNWHDRSLAPERLWGAAYDYLLELLSKHGAWFATASQAVSWFRKRRSVVFERDPTDATIVRVRSKYDNADQTPALIVRTHKFVASNQKIEHVDQVLEGELDVRTSGLMTC